MNNSTTSTALKNKLTPAHRLLLLFLLISSPSFAKAPIMTLYLSTDQTGAQASSISIEQGIRTALSENNNQLGGRRISLKTMDHRGNTVRARKHFEAYLADPNALAVFTGLHSPPPPRNAKFH